VIATAWTMHANGGTMQAFMAGGAHRPEAGIEDDVRSARPAVALGRAFLAEALGG
jgi:hypothetical protein